MESIRVEEFHWGWEIDIPCLKCGKFKCEGVTYTYCSKPELYYNYSRVANNIKEAIDVCIESRAKYQIHRCTNSTS